MLQEPPRQLARQRSFHDIGREQLERLWAAIHASPVPESVSRAFALLVPEGHPDPTWPSFVSDDHSPYEFSVLLDGASAELRLMAEPLPASGPVDLAATRAAGLALREVLRRELDVDFARLDAIADLFLPEDPRGTFALWYAASFDASGKIAWKAYVNPAARGRAAAPRLVEEALHRLGFEGAWATVTRAMTRGPVLDELRFFSVDLGRDPKARAKVYGFHHAATPAWLARVLAVVPGADTERVERFCRTLTGGDGALAARRQPATCLAFVDGSPAPATGTLHVPVRAFAGSDAVAHARVLEALAVAEVPTGVYEGALAALATRPLAAGSGAIAWCALRTGGAHPKATVYLAPRALTDEPSHDGSAPHPAADDVRSVVEGIERDPVTEHPFFARLAREELNLAALTLFVLNIREAITRHFARRLASVVARVDEEPIRSMLCKQLNDELGDGDPSRTHRLLFERFAEGLAEWTPTSGLDALVAPGRAFGELQEELYLRRSAYEGVGATLVMEAYGKQADLALGREFRRKREALPATVLEWLTLHEALELDHVDESLDIADLIPKGPKAILAARGAAELADGAWTFLDALYRLAFSGRPS